MKGFLVRFFVLITLMLSSLAIGRDHAQVNYSCESEILALDFETLCVELASPSFPSNSPSVHHLPKSSHKSPFQDVTENNEEEENIHDDSLVDGFEVIPLTYSLNRLYKSELSIVTNDAVRTLVPLYILLHSWKCFLG
jgi:hypothetical protein